MRLRTFYPPIAPSLIDALESIGVRTDSELLFTHTPSDIYCQLPSDYPITLLEIQNLVKDVRSRVAAPFIRGDEKLKAEEHAAEDRYVEDMQSGVIELDNLVKAFGMYELLEISGDRGSGKSALALHIVLRHLCGNADSTIFWIDTKGEFSPERASSLINQFSEYSYASTALDRLQVHLAFDVDAVEEALESLRPSLISGTTITLRCIVIDTVTPLFRSLLSASSSQGHAIMTTFMQELRSFSKKHCVTIFILNDTASAAPYNPQSVFHHTVRKPALGLSFTYMTDATLWLAKWVEPQSEVEDKETTLESDRERGPEDKYVKIDCVENLVSFPHPIRWCRHGSLMSPQAPF
ncbi:P-loop containing nucleoside triphosphate hydrolase [Abortiporus biennis]